MSSTQLPFYTVRLEYIDPASIYSETEMKNQLICFADEIEFMDEESIETESMVKKLRIVLSSPDFAYKNQRSQIKIPHDSILFLEINGVEIIKSNSYERNLLTLDFNKPSF